MKELNEWHECNGGRSPGLPHWMRILNHLNVELVENIELPSTMLGPAAIEIKARLHVFKILALCGFSIDSCSPCCLSYSISPSLPLSFPPSIHLSPPPPPLSLSLSLSLSLLPHPPSLSLSLSPVIKEKQMQGRQTRYPKTTCYFGAIVDTFLGPVA